MKTLLKIALILCIELLIRSYIPDSVVQLAWIPLAIGAGLGLANAFFGSSDRRSYSKADMEKYGYRDFDPTKAKGDLARITSARLKGRRAGISAQNQQSGLNNPTDVYSNEEDLVNAQMQGNINIDAQDRAEENQIAMNLFNMNESQPQDDNFFEKFLSAGVLGANLGYRGQELADKTLPGTDDGEDSPITDVTAGNQGNTLSSIFPMPGTQQSDQFGSFLNTLTEAEREKLFKELKGNKPFFDYLGSNNIRR